MRKIENILVTGGSGFIGSNFINFLFSLKEFKGKIINVDKLTYAGNPENLKNVEKQYPERYFFEKQDICNTEMTKNILNKYCIDSVVHFAAESHVDRSIEGPIDFIQTNIVGTFSMLEAVKSVCDEKRKVHFHHVSTDEVYGSLGKTGLFTENTPYDPRSPYSASKASSDHLVRAYFHTYGLRITVSNCSNNYGPYQFPEKLIPVVILNALENKEIPVYGDGKNVRDWLYVEDHCLAIYEILKNGKNGETYNIGGDCQVENISIIKKICNVLDKKLKRKEGSSEKLIRFVKDRPGHDRRYAIDCTKLKNDLNIKPNIDFNKGIELTITWYLENKHWIENIKSGEYLKWMEKNYKNR